jgi:transcriptional regulator with XRE-family HTH domain
MAAVDDEFKRRFGQRLRELRQARGLSQEKLAEQADLSVTYVSSLERGRYNPSLRNLMKLARALGCRVEDLTPAGE